VGQFGPSWEVASPRRRLPADLILFSTGFLTASVASFWLLAAVGELVRSSLTANTRTMLATGTLTLLASVEVLRLRRGSPCSLGLSRQTPRHWGLRSPFGVLGWGLDTGVPFTTVRATALPLVVCSLSLLGYATGWLGVMYGIGFLASLSTSSWLTSRDLKVRASDWPSSLPDPARLMNRALRLHGAVRTGSVTLVVVSAATLPLW
jgi:hypothetical protein